MGVSVGSDETLCLLGIIGSGTLDGGVLDDSFGGINGGGLVLPSITLLSEML